MCTTGTHFYTCYSWDTTYSDCWSIQMLQFFLESCSPDNHTLLIKVTWTDTSPRVNCEWCHADKCNSLHLWITLPLLWPITAVTISANGSFLASSGGLVPLLGHIYLQCAKWIRRDKLEYGCSFFFLSLNIFASWSMNSSFSLIIINVCWFPCGCGFITMPTNTVF